MQRDIISIRLSAIIGTKSLSVYLDNLVTINDKIKHKFFRLKQQQKNEDLILVNKLFLAKNINFSVIIIEYVLTKFCYDIKAKSGRVNKRL